MSVDEFSELLDEYEVTFDIGFPMDRERLAIVLWLWSLKLEGKRCRNLKSPPSDTKPSTPPYPEEPPVWH